MRIDELTAQDQMSLNMTKWKSVAQVQKFLKSNGFKQLGAGQFSQAWTAPGENTVVKISTQEDVCWLRFAKWVRKQASNKHLPKIHSIRTYNTKDGELFVSRIEKLEEVDDYFFEIEQLLTKEKDPSKVAEMLWVRTLDYDNPRHILQDMSVIEPMLKSPLRKNPKFKGISIGHLILRIMQEYTTTSPLIKTVRKASKEVLQDRRCFADLHSGNIMKRRDGTIVIVDPAAMYETTK